MEYFQLTSYAQGIILPFKLKGVEGNLTNVIEMQYASSVSVWSPLKLPLKGSYNKPTEPDMVRENRLLKKCAYTASRQRQKRLTKRYEWMNNFIYREWHVTVETVKHVALP